MALVQPFCAWRYNVSRVGDLSLVTAPPYDVIDPALQEQLLAHPYNILWLDLHPASADERQHPNRYERAAALWQQWREEGIFVRDSRPAFYLYEQEYTLAGKVYRRRGVIGRVQLEEPGEGFIFPHEETLTAPLADRLALMKATHCNLSQILGLYPDARGAVMALLEPATARNPDVQVIDREGIVNRIWAIRERACLAQITALFSSKPLFIADGHHRYKTALAYRDWLQERQGDLPPSHPANFVSFVGVSLSDPGLTVFPTHRCVSRLEGFSVARLRAVSEKHFVWEEGTFPPDRPEVLDEHLRRADASLIGVFDPTGPRMFWLHPRQEDPLAALLPDHSRSWRKLAVALLHRLLFDRCLIPAFGEPTVNYVPWTAEAIRRCREQESQVAFLLPPPPLEAFQSIVQNRELMPPKSTYFYPKPLTGLVLYSLEEEAPRAGEIKANEALC